MTKVIKEKDNTPLKKPYLLNSLTRVAVTQHAVRTGHGSVVSMSALYRVQHMLLWSCLIKDKQDISYWQKSALNNGKPLPGALWLSNCPDMTSAVYHGCIKATNQTNKLHDMPAI